MGINPIIIIISIWSGTIIFFSAVVAPTVFKSLDEREAGVFLRAFFPKYYIFGIVLGVISIIYLLFSPVHSHLLYSILAMTVLTILGRMSIPIINKARDTNNEQAFKRYHLISVIMNVLTLVIGIIILGMLL
jgi:heme A synthase